MVGVKEELELAKAAKAAVKALSTATSKPAALATLKDAYRAAVQARDFLMKHVA